MNLPQYWANHDKFLSRGSVWLQGVTATNQKTRELREIRIMMIKENIGNQNAQYKWKMMIIITKWPEMPTISSQWHWGKVEYLTDRVNYWRNTASTHRLPYPFLAKSADNMSVEHEMNPNKYGFNKQAVSTQGKVRNNSILFQTFSTQTAKIVSSLTQ